MYGLLCVPLTIRDKMYRLFFVICRSTEFEKEPEEEKVKVHMYYMKKAKRHKVEVNDFEPSYLFAVIIIEMLRK